MHDELPVFQLNLGPMEVLLPAADFYAVAAGPEINLQEGRELLLFNGQELACIRLEQYFRSYIKAYVETDEQESGTTAFLLRWPGAKDRAYLAERPFEMLNYPLSSFHLIPNGLRQYLSQLGFIALRITDKGVIQYVLNVQKLKTLPEQEWSP